MDRKMKLTFRYSSGLKERMYLRYRSASASSSTTTGAIKEQPQQPYLQVVYAFGAYIQVRTNYQSRAAAAAGFHIFPETEQSIRAIQENEVVIRIACVLTGCG